MHLYVVNLSVRFYAGTALRASCVAEVVFCVSIAVIFVPDGTKLCLVSGLVLWAPACGFCDKMSWASTSP